ncbi:AAA family ATPase [Pseudoclavibacter chungangensis]|uniref:AAA family ATPase n=2 Tax=Pseudoclavibacter chungangensis TaxID=587635 RepID=A0A7J5C0I6_9MICO|nr:AAA family ATPase [Pseudoclavibacter chungangensis]
MGTLSLATGIAEWTHDDVHHRAPVLTRPVGLRRIGRDYEVVVKGQTHVNASLVRAIAEQFGVRLVPRELLELVRGTDAFLPQAVFDRVRSETARIPGFTVSARAVVSSFGDVADAMLRDATRLDHPMLRALAGDPSAVVALERASGGPGEATKDSRPDRPAPDRRDPATDRLLLDADGEQERVVDAIAAGGSLVVDAMPGTGLTQTVVNAIGTLVADGRRVLVVSPRSASLRAIRMRFRAIGLDGLALTPRTLRRDAIAAISRNERAAKPDVGEIDDALVRLRHVLADYRAAMTRPDPVLGVTVVETLDELARLELGDRPPSTTARLDRTAIEALAAGRDEVAMQLREVGTLGQFRYGPDDSPWYGVAFESTEDANLAQRTARELADGEVADVVEEAQRLVGRTRLRSAETFAELGIYLRLLLDIRETLDRFKPEVFDRSLAELIQATAPRRDAGDMTSARKRQLRQLARDYVRPGVTVPDLHENLQLVQRQRILWQRYVTDGSTPTVPTGIAESRAEHRAVAERLRIVDGPLVEAGAPSLIDVPLDELQERLDELAAESEVLDNLVERLRITERLHGLGLEPLLVDLADRHVPADELAAELELAWWQSVLEDLLERDKSLLNANTRVLTRLEGDFRLVDQAHTEASAAQLAWQLAEEWKIALVDHEEQAGELRQLLRRAGLSSARLAAQAGAVSEPLTHVWLTTPYDVPLVSDAIEFDTVVLVDAAAVSLPEVVGAIRRGRQLVAFGDPVTQFPSPFSIAVRTTGDGVGPEEGLSEDEVRESVAASAYAKLAALVPEHRLTHSYRAGGEDLAELVNRRFYEGRIRSMPWAGTFLGFPSLSYSFVEGGSGMPDPVSGAVDSTDAEVTRVVELVIDHAIHRPRESLMVVSASPRHALRVQQAVYSAASKRAELAPFFTEERGEPFISTTIERSTAQSRDRVILSVGYGRTPHGRVLSDFGVLGTAMGERALAVAMTRARRSLVIVSSIRPGEMDPSRMSRGTLGLAQILGEAEQQLALPERTSEDAAPMLLDLARRLEDFGMRVELDHRGRIPLAAAYGGRAIAIDTDGTDADVIGDVEPTLRESLRLRPELLKRLGWYYLRVHSFELFANPDAVARRVATALQVPLPSESTALPASGRRGEVAGSTGIGAVELSEADELAASEEALARASRPHLPRAEPDARREPDERREDDGQREPDDDGH